MACDVLAANPPPVKALFQRALPGCSCRRLGVAVIKISLIAGLDAVAAGGDAVALSQPSLLLPLLLSSHSSPVLIVLLLHAVGVQLPIPTNH